MIEFVPEPQQPIDNVNVSNVEVRSGVACLGNTLDSNYSELDAISAIQESLMQCESAVAAKGGSPPSPIQVSLQQCTPSQVVFSTSSVSNFLITNLQCYQIKSSFNLNQRNATKLLQPALFWLEKSLKNYLQAKE